MILHLNLGPRVNHSAQVCYFGEKHPTTGNETWKEETCQPNEDHCFQMVSQSGFEVRQVSESDCGKLCAF